MSSLLPSPLRRLTHGPLKIEVGSQDETWLVSVSGELDLSCAAPFENEVQRLLTAELGSVVVDLDELEFIDSSGLRALVRLARQSRANGDRLRIVPPRGHPDEVLRMSGIRELLPLIP